MQPLFTRTASRGNNCRYAGHRWVRFRKECACGSTLNAENSTFNVEISPRIKILPERSCCTTSGLVPATTRFAVNQAPHRNVRRERGLPADAFNVQTFDVENRFATAPGYSREFRSQPLDRMRHGSSFANL